MKELTKETFANEVLAAETPVLVDFFATWCGPCKMLSPVLSEFAEEHEGKVKVVKVDVDNQPELAAAYRVASIPTLLLFRNGKVEGRSVGFRRKAQLEQMLG